MGISIIDRIGNAVLLCRCRGSLLSATDPDVGNTFTFSLVAGSGSDDNASFLISGNALTINAASNFEAKNSYSVRIRVTDQGGWTFEKPLTITVNNVNEGPTGIVSIPRIRF